MFNIFFGDHLKTVDRLAHFFLKYVKEDEVDRCLLFKVQHGLKKKSYLHFLQGKLHCLQSYTYNFTKANRENTVQIMSLNTMCIASKIELILNRSIK